MYRVQDWAEVRRLFELSRVKIVETGESLVLI